VVKRGVDDAMYCEACGAHRDQLGLAGDEIRPCPDCGRATCSNCWNQVAGACLTCRAFALPLAAMAPPTTVAPPPPVAAAIALAPRRPTTPRRLKRAVKPQPDPVVTAMPRVVEPVAATASGGMRWDVERFGKVRIGRVIRATAIGSVLAISIGAVGFAGVLRLGPTTVGGDSAVQEPVTPPGHSIDPGPAVTHVAVPSAAPTHAAVTTGPDDRGEHPGPTDPSSGGGSTGGHPAGGGPPATIQPAVTATPTAGATATPTADPTATPEPTPTPDPPTPTPDPPTPTPDPPTPTPDPPTPTPDPPTPTPDPPTPTPDPPTPTPDPPTSEP
jgi:hypothetical protein